MKTLSAAQTKARPSLSLHTHIPPTQDLISPGPRTPPALTALHVQAAAAALAAGEDESLGQLAHALADAAPAAAE